MAVPRIFSQGRVLLARGSASSRVASSVFLSGRIAAPRRQFTARTWALQEVASNQSMNAQSAVPPSVESSPNYHESSVTLLRVPKRASKHEIEELFKKAGFEVKRIQILIDRFTFQNCRMCYVQLGNESQAQEAIKRLDKNASLGSPIVVKGLRPDFVWGLGPEAVKNVDFTTLVFHDDAGLATALAPQLEGRRIRIGSPGWTDGPVSKRMEVARRIITEHFSKFGIECIGKMQPNTDWIPNKPRFLCLIDFKTKQGAEEAIKALDGTQIEGKPIFVNRSPMAPWRAWQLNKVDKRALAQLEKRGYAPPAIQPDKFDKAAPIRKAKKEKRKAEWDAKNQAEHDAKVAARKAGRKAQESAA